MSEEIQKKWQAIIDHPDLPKIVDPHRRQVTAHLLENTEKYLREVALAGGRMLNEEPINAVGDLASVNSGGTGNMDKYDPILISLIRRAMPNLVAYDIAGVQPMTGPTGLIFAMRSQTIPGAAVAIGNNAARSEAFYSEADTDNSGTGTHEGTTGTANTANTGVAMATASAEALGDSGGTLFNEMTFTIDKVTVTAKSRALKAAYTIELAQDLKAIHGLDADSELSAMLQTEILAEINREVVRTVYNTAKRGANNTTTAGTFNLDVDANGRWSVEKFKGLMFFIEQEANIIAKDTRRGRGNIILCSSDVASALQMAGVLDYTPAIAGNNGLVPDDTGNTFVGVLNGRYRVYIDPYAAGNFLVVGYKGSNPFDAGLFYCPYVPLQMVRAVDPNNFQPQMGFKTRYGIVANPFAQGSSVSNQGAITANTNVYYRRTLVSNLL